MKRVLVSGATGFIGRACLPILSAKGYEVHGVFLNEYLEGCPEIHWHKADLLAPEQMRRLIYQVQPTDLLHLAWVATPGKYPTSPGNLAWLRSGVELLELFAELGGKRFVGAGTCMEYSWEYGYCREQITPLHPSTLYGTCKNALFSVIDRWSKLVGLSSAWGRIFFLYGPHENPRRLVSSVIRNLVLGGIAPCTAGTQIRDFMHVSDVAAAFVGLLDSDVTGPVNVASGRPVTIREVVETIGRQLQCTDRVRLGALSSPREEPGLLLADVGRLKNEVGFSPEFDLETGIADTVRWWQQELLVDNSHKS